MNGRRAAILAAIILVAAALLGGASRASEAAQLPLRLVAIAVIVAACWTPDRARLARLRPLFLFGAAALAIGIVQLIPLPAGLWQALPGRAFYADLARQAGIADVARPISFTPGLTLHAVLALLVPAAVLVSAGALPSRRLPWLLLAWLVPAMLGLVLGYAQLAAGPASPLRLYAVTNRDAMVGLFANRNHHALLLATALPILFALAGLARGQRRYRVTGPAVALAAAVAIAATLLLSGSRAGLLVGAVGLLAGAVLYATIAAALPGAGSRRARADRPRTTRGPALVVGGAAAAIVLFGALFARSPTMQRLLAVDPAEEVRVQLFRPTVDLAAAMLPLGGGLGAFDALFRRFEPDRYLRLTYQNQAHMEPLQVAIEAGLPGLLLLAAVLVWWARASVAAWRAPPPATPLQALPRLGSILFAMPLLASLGDYPLRTPLHAALLTLAAIFLQLGRRAHPSAAADAKSTS